MASAPPSIPHSEGNARKGKKQRVNGGKNKPPLPPIIADPLPYHLLNNEEVLIASKLPEGFPPELAFRALAAYSLIRTLSIELRLSPFSPNAFLRALILPCPNILLGKVHVALLRVLLPALKMGYSYSERGRGLCVSKRRRDGVWWDLRGGDNLTYMDALTWPLFYDDYVHLTADHLWKMMNDPELHYGSNNVALQSTDEEEQKLATEREDVPRTSNVAFQNRLDRYLPGIEVEHSPLKSRRPRAEQISPPSRGDSDVDVEIDSGSEFGGSDVEEEDDDEEYGVKNRVKWSRGPPSGTERPRGRPRGSASKSIASASGNGTVRVPLKPNLAPGSRVISAEISVLPGVLVSLPAKTSPEVLKSERERFLPKKSSSSSQPMKGVLATQLSIQGSGMKRSLPRYPNRQQVQQPAITTDEPSAKRTKVSYTNGNANRVHVPPPVQPAYHLPGQIDSRYPLSTAAKPIPPCAAKNLSGTTAQLKEPPKPFPGAMGMVPGFMYAPYSMTQPLMPAPCPHMIKGVPALHSQTTRPYSQIVAEKKSQNGYHPVAPNQAMHVPPSWRPKLNAIVGETKLPVLDPVEQNVGTHNSISPDIAIAIQRYQMSDGGTCIETNPLGSEKPDTEVATLPQQEDSTGITEGPVATQTNRTESAAKAIRLPAGSAKGDVSAFLPDTYEWPQFSSINYMRSGIPHHRLPLEEKLRIMEFLLDELLTVDTISMEFERRRHKTSAYHYPYGPLPSSHELESLSNEDECGLCRKEGELVCCDGCVRSYHSYCIGLPTGERLPDKWLCPECVTVDPCHFGPLLGGQKSSLDWFTLRDLKVPVGMNVRPVSDETEFLVVHGFVFTRPCSKSREVSSKSKENEVYESHHYSPSSQDDLYRILQMIGPDACSSWPFSQIPMDPTKIWMHVNEPTRTQQMVRYFSQRESFDPTAYLNLYRMAPLSSSLQAKGSKKTLLLLSDYESECGSSDVRNLKKMLSRDMSHDMGIARCLRSSTILYNPYEMIISFVLRLEASFRRGCLLDENWGIRNGVYNPQQWPKEMRQCRSLKKIAQKVVHLVDSCHVRVFERGWTDRASSSIGSKTLMRDTGVSSASNDGRRYETLSEDWTFSGEMARRRWRRARDSNVLSLLSRESFHLDGSAHTAESVALKFARTKRKKDGASKKDNEVWKSATFDTDNSIVQLSDNGDPPPSVEAKSTAGRCSNGIANQIPSSTLSVPRTTAKDHSSIEMESVAMSPQQTRETNKKATTTIASKIGSTARDSEHEALTAGPAVDMEEEHQQRAMSPGSSCLQPTETKNMPLSANSKTNEAIIPDKSPQSSLLSSDLAKIPPAVLEGMLHPPSRTNDIELIGTSDISRVESAMTENKERTQKYLAPNPTVFGAKEIVTAMKSKEVVSSIERNGAIRTIDDQYKQIVVEPTIVKSKNENDLLSEARKKKQATRTERSKKSRSAEQSAKGRRRSGRLNHRNDFSNQMDSLLTGSDHVQESSSEQYIHHSDGQFDHTILVDSERKRRLGRLEDLVTNPSPEELEWPVAGRKLFDPLGYLPPAEMRRLGRNAGLVTAQFVQYTTYEVGEVSAFHAWRKRMLRVNSLEDLILQIRVLNSFIDKQTVYSCESLARPTPKAKSQVQKRVVCKQRDLQTGMMYYFVVNEGPVRRRGCWFSSEDIDLSVLILDRLNCIEKKLEAFERPLETPIPTPRPRQKMQVSGSNLVASSSATLMKGLPLASQVAFARANADMEAIIAEHGVNVGRMFLHSRELGNTAILQAQMPQQRLASVLKLKSVFSTLELYGFPPKAEHYITSLLIGVENAEIDKLKKLEELYQAQRAAISHEGFGTRISQNVSLSTSLPWQVAGVAVAAHRQFAELPDQFGKCQRTSPIEPTLQQPTIAWHPNQSSTQHISEQQHFSNENVRLQHHFANTQAGQLPPHSMQSHTHESLCSNIAQSSIDQMDQQSWKLEQAPNHCRPRRQPPTEHTPRQQFEQNTNQYVVPRQQRLFEQPENQQHFHQHSNQRKSPIVQSIVRTDP